MKRPARKAIPAWIKKLVCKRQKQQCPCGCGHVVSHEKGSGTEFDHEPALILRDVDPSGTDYIPAQLDPAFIVARCRRSHKEKTSGSGATTAGSDIGKMKKERKRNKALAAIAGRPVSIFKAALGKSRTFSSRGFPPKGSRPFRRGIR